MIDAQPDAVAVTLVIEGRVIGPWVEEVRGACAPHLARRRHIIVDLAGVSFADAEGIDLLRELMRRRVTLINASPFVRQQLQRDDSGPFPARGRK